MDNELKLWTIAVSLPRQSAHPRNPSYYSRNQTVNVAAPDILSAIEGALDELLERNEGLTRDECWVVSAAHKGRVNRIVGAT